MYQKGYFTVRVLKLPIRALNLVNGSDQLHLLLVVLFFHQLAEDCVIFICF